MNRLTWLGSVAILACLSAYVLSPAHARQSAPPRTATFAGNGLVTIASNHSVADTLDRFEAAVRAKKWVVFTRLDHAAAAKAAGLPLRPRTVVVFGNPKDGTAPMQTNPTVAIDFPLKALVWQDDGGRVWLTYNSAEFLRRNVYARHGLAFGQELSHRLAKLLGDIAQESTR